MITFVMYNCAVTITVTFVLHYGAPVSVTLDKKSRINLHLSLAVISCCALTICPHHVHFLYCHTVSHRLRFRGLIFSARNHISYKTAFPTLNKSFAPFFWQLNNINCKTFYLFSLGFFTKLNKISFAKNCFAVLPASCPVPSSF